MQAANPVQCSLLDQVRERLQRWHYSCKTESANLYRMRFFTCWGALKGGGMRRPQESGMTDSDAQRRVISSVYLPSC